MSGVPDTSPRYDDASAAGAYAARSRARHESELRMLASLLSGIELGWILDAPCGASRLAPFLVALGGRYVGLDRSGAMLEAASGSRPRLVRGSLESLPFGDRAFDTVICFRYLHHAPAAAQPQVVRELARVAGTNLVVSAFHPISSHRLARTIRSRLGRESARYVTPPKAIDRWLRPLGLDLLARRRQGPLRDLWIGLWRRAANGRRANPGR